MCGLFGGVSTTLSAQEVDCIKYLGLVSSLRGLDSIGIAAAYRKGNKGIGVRVNKSLAAAGDFIFDSHWNFDKTISNAHAIIGHCRAATVGSVTTENAHPYEFDRIVGAHNGGVRGVVPHFVDKKDDHTDSYYLYRLMSEQGYKEAISRARHGAYALTWFDLEDNTLNIVRNSERPLWLAANENETTVFWASEAAFLDFALKRSGLYGSFNQVKMLPPNIGLKLKIGDWSMKASSFECDPEKWMKEKEVVSSNKTHGFLKRPAIAEQPKQITKEAISAAASAVESYLTKPGAREEDRCNDSPPWRNSWEDDLALQDSRKDKTHGTTPSTTGTKPSTSKPADHKPGKAQASVPTAPVAIIKREADEDSLHWYLGWNKIKFRLSFIAARLHCGCSHCGSKNTPVSKVWWISEFDYLCESCMKTDFAKEYLKDYPMYGGVLYKNKQPYEKHVTH